MTGKPQQSWYRRWLSEKLPDWAKRAWFRQDRWFEAHDTASRTRSVALLITMTAALWWAVRDTVVPQHPAWNPSLLSKGFRAVLAVLLIFTLFWISPWLFKPWKHTLSKRFGDGWDRCVAWVDAHEYLKHALSVGTAAIVLTVIGDNFFQFALSGEVWRADDAEQVRRFVLFCLSIGLAGWKRDEFLKFLRNLIPVESENATQGSDFDTVNTPDALIAFVSTQPLLTPEEMDAYINGTDLSKRPAAFQSSIQQLFIGRRGAIPAKKRHVYLLHSGKSKTYADDYEKIWGNSTRNDFEIHIGDYSAVFERIKDCHELCTRAVNDARVLPDVESVAIDITGGTKPTSSAAVLVGLDLDVDLYYIDQQSNEIRGMDVNWRKVPTS